MQNIVQVRLVNDFTPDNLGVNNLLQEKGICFERAKAGKERQEAIFQAGYFFHSDIAAYRIGNDMCLSCILQSLF